MPSRRAFTLVELLVVITIVGLLAALAVPAISKSLQRSKQAASLSNIRQLGMAMLAYAADHNMSLPARATGSGGVRWPRALYDSMLPDVRTFVDPSDPKPASTDPDTFFRNNRNNSSYVFNGFNDLGTLDDPSFQVNLNRLAQPSSTILFSKKRRQRGDFYMDVLEGSRGNHVEVLDWDTYGNTLHYFFADGSARWLTPAQYRDEYWLADKDFTFP
jgi:prepilin-type N-terminal cleavage/methylation domain-containing protein